MPGSIRTCVGCGAKKPKTALVRVVSGPSGAQVDRTGRLEGRGAYLCPLERCVDAAVKSRRLSRVFGSGIEQDLARWKREIVIKNG